MVDSQQHHADQGGHQYFETLDQQSGTALLQCDDFKKSIYEFWTVVIVVGLNAHSQDAFHRIGGDPDKNPSLHHFDNMTAEDFQDGGTKQAEEDQQGQNKQRLKQGAEGNGVDQRLCGDRNHQ